MPQLDITASLTGFRTFRTLPGELRARETIALKLRKEDLEQNSKQTTYASVRDVRQHYRESLTLPPDQAAWLPVARQILAGEFKGADRSTVESLTIGLHGIRHPFCQQALEKLKENPAR